MRVVAESRSPRSWGTTRARAARRSPEVLALVALLLGAAACLALAVVGPISEQAPVRLGRLLIAVAVVMAVGTFLAGDRLPRPVLAAEAVVGAVLNSVIVAASHTSGGVMVDAIAYAWLTVYVALFFPAAAEAFAGLVVLLFGAGIVVAGVPGMATAWAVVSLTVISAAVVVSRVSRHIRRDAVTDQLTGALNRAGLAAEADRVGPRRRRGEQRIAVAIVDLDGFKRVNDRHGHAAGDRLLVELTAAWDAALRHTDVLARTGGDEFVLIMPATTAEEAGAVLARLRRSHPARWSAGTVTWDPGESLDACLERADRRLYAAKAAAAA